MYILFFFFWFCHLLLLGLFSFAGRGASPCDWWCLGAEEVAAQLTATLGVEKEPPSGGVVEEVRQVVKDAQPVLPSASLAVQDPEPFSLLFPRILNV